MLGQVMVVNDKQYVVYGDWGYKTHLFLENLIYGSNILDVEGGFNLGMSKSRMMVERTF